MWDIINKGQGAYAHLRGCRPNYQVFDAVFLSSSSHLNEDFKKLVQHLHASQSFVKMLIKNVLKLEKALQGIQLT